MKWEDYLTEASILIESRENYQRRLGKMASEIVSTFGAQKLDEFSSAVKENYGLSLSSSTLRNYRWVYEQTKDLNLPEDMSYRTLQYVASSNDPAAWAERIKKEGLSSPEALRLLREEKGKLPKEKTITCPNCQTVINL